MKDASDPSDPANEPYSVETQGGSRWGALAGLVIVAALIGGVVIVINHLHQSAALQDCVASGRRNCAPIDAPAR